jgi:hypothetical protein
LEVVLRNDVILTSSRAFPTPDTNHACLLRTSPEGADGLIAEVTAYFGSRNLQGDTSPVVIYVSPACAPGDLRERLLARGFHRQQEEESWMVLEDLPNFNLPSPYPGFTVKPITKSEATVFAEVFMAAFDLPIDFAPLMAQLIEPTVGLSTVLHYLALEEGQPVGTCSMLRHESFGVLGSTGVLTRRRGAGAATSLAVRALTDARDHGVHTVMLQTAADTWLERFLRISGFERAFTRRCYVLPDESPG